jgi:putative ATP-binding cassette transporter
VVLHAPAWILIDDALRSLDGDTLERFMDVLAHEMLHTAVIHIGGGQARNPMFSRTLHLIKAPMTAPASASAPVPAPVTAPGTVAS